VQPTAHALDNPGAAAAAAEHVETAHPAAVAKADSMLQQGGGKVSSSDDTAHKLREAFQAEPCKKRACTTAVDMFAAFQESRFSQNKLRGLPHVTAAQGAALPPSYPPPSDSSTGTGTGTGTTSSSSSTGQRVSGPAAAHAAAGAATVEQLPGHPTNDQPSNDVSQQQQQQQQPFWFYEDDMPCPPDILELGRSTWTLLHRWRSWVALTAIMYPLWLSYWMHVALQALNYSP
jgi:hypothetical protein